ncbi:MAG TPA: hypothetical protein VKB65_03060 [Myxococcota bacterium]|nr:hypothetical protein [Myxococcota bacterium]
MHVGLLIVATGRYAGYLPGLLSDCAERFLPKRERTAFVFSDALPPQPPGLRVVHVPTAHEPWPHPTLHRYHYFCRARTRLETEDVLYYLDADTRVVAEVGDEILPDAEHPLAAVAHPGYCGRWARDGRLARAARALGLGIPERRWVARPRRGAYETRPESTACVARHEGRVYLMGGFYGGRTAAFLAMAERIRADVDRDAARGITAVWHDESHLNRYLIDHPPRVLTPSHGFPEGWDLPFPPRIVLLDKDHAAMRAPIEA